MNPTLKNLILWLVISMVIMSILGNITSDDNKPTSEVTYSTFLEQVSEEYVAKAVISGAKVTYVTQNGQKLYTIIPNGYDKDLINELYKNGVEFQGQLPEGQSLLTSLFISAFPILLLIAVWIFFMRKMQGSGGKGGSGAMSFGKSKAKLVEQVKTRMADVAGCDEAKEEVQDLIEFLKAPQEFMGVGGKPPTGTLLLGPPGTGKTLLARALAGEAGVPFFTISGSDFVEMFVGVGASRVRDMFEQAKKAAPCIIYIDEIDAVGRKRGVGTGGGHDEREQTLNQMLVEMDGFEGNEGILVIASTNRADVLDPALLRPGRFNRHVHVGLPDIIGREEILKVHARKIPLGEDVDLSIIARGTPGFSGAKLEDLLNEAALWAAKHKKKVVDREDIRHAQNKILMGKERKVVMSDDDKWATAYHEACHALPGYIMHLLGHHDPVYAVSNVPRGHALGVTMYLPEADRYSQNKGDLTAFIVSLLGGRRGELLYHKGDALKISTGASNDLERASEIVRRMVKEWGYSKELGLLTFKTNEYGQTNGAPELLAKVDTISKNWLAESDKFVQDLIDKHEELIHAMAKAVVEKGTIYDDEIEEVFGVLKNEYEGKKLELNLE